VTPIAVFVGPPGSGKSTVGRIVAGRFGAGFRDTDEDIEARSGKTVMDIFIEDGEDTFRAMEREAVELALREHDGVLALGGGAVIDPQTRTRLHGHRVAFLDVGLATASERVGFNTNRPLLVVNPRAELKRMLDARRPLYEEVATAVVGTDGRTPDEVADDVIAALELRS
jgi:shikimate kinase